VLSGDGAALAVLDATATCLSILHAKEEDDSAPSSSAPWRLVRHITPTHLGSGTASAPDPVGAFCWAEDSSKLAFACASGHIYVMDRCVPRSSAASLRIAAHPCFAAHPCVGVPSRRRSATPLSMLSPSGMPWAGKQVGALALPAPGQVLLLITASSPALLALPLGAPTRVLAAVRPVPLAQAHLSIRTAAYDPGSATLVLAGDGAPARATAAPTQGPAGPSSGAMCVSVSAWRLAATAGASGRSPGVQLTHLGSYTGFVGFREDAAAAAGGGVGGAVRPWQRSRWALRLSPLGEAAALAVPPAGGLLVVALPGCAREEPGERFAGRTAPAMSALRVG
jgi:hypothetical protein